MKMCFEYRMCVQPWLLLLFFRTCVFVSYSIFILSTVLMASCGEAVYKLVKYIRYKYFKMLHKSPAEFLDPPVILLSREPSLLPQHPALQAPLQKKKQKKLARKPGETGSCN